MVRAIFQGVEACAGPTLSNWPSPLLGVVILLLSAADFRAGLTKVQEKMRFCQVFVSNVIGLKKRCDFGPRPPSIM